MADIEGARFKTYDVVRIKHHDFPVIINSMWQGGSEGIFYDCIWFTKDLHQINGSFSEKLLEPWEGPQ